MKYGQIRQYDVANGVGVRTSVFVTGCYHHCYNCFNEEYQSFEYGKEWTDQETQKVIEYLSDDKIKGLSLLGGEPMANVPELTQIVRTIKQHVKKPIWLWSGDVFEQIILDDHKRDLLKEIDVLVDGKFVESLKNLNLKFRGSSNQRIIDVQKTLQNKEIVLLDM